MYTALGTRNLIRDESLSHFWRKNYDSYRNQFAPSHCLLSEAIQEIPEVANETTLRVAVIRHPYDRAVSMFEFSKQENLGEL